MLSAFPAMPSSDGLFAIQFPAFEGGFTPWDCQEPFFPFQPQEPAFLSNKPQEPVISNSGSDHSNPKPVPSNSNSGSDNSNPKHVALNSGSDDPNRPNQNKNNLSCGSDDPNQPVSVIDERKRRRMISNRESARRSRMRKQKHLENLRNQANRLRFGNRDIMNRLRLETHNCQLVRRDNERLQLESAMLREKLWAIHQILLLRELQQ